MYIKEKQRSAANNARQKRMCQIFSPERKILMNVYDFDGAICYPDSSVNFAICCMSRHPRLWFAFFPKALWNLLLYKKGKMTRALMLRKFFTILHLKDFNRLIERYRDTHEKNNSAWYLAQKKPDDLIISASPSCIIGQIARRLGVRFVATEYDREFGVFTDTYGIIPLVMPPEKHS